MSLIDLSLKSSYESDIDDLIQDFYIPVLGQSVSYNRIAGFFSSSSLVVASRGIAGLIYNKGKMRILACPQISKEEVGIINSLSRGRQFLEDKLLEDIKTISNEIEKDHLEAMGWMLENGYLEIRIAYVVSDENNIEYDRLFHQKIGILKDYDGNTISFSGSINETASGWLYNVEEFKVFKSWELGQQEYLLFDENRFDDFWKGNRRNITTVELPKAVKEHMIKSSTNFNKEKFVAKHYLKFIKQKTIDEKLSLFSYQKDAVQKWIQNKYRLFFEMATGTGKTRTALACINQLLKQNQQLVVIISCPQNTLSKQWKENEVEPAGFKFDEAIIADGTNINWKSNLSTALTKLSIGLFSTLIIYTTHATSSNYSFLNLIMSSDTNIPICFIGDEAHSLGSYKTRNALLARYQYRIGLSATPMRWFDDYGTTILNEYFGKESFIFSISDALTTINPITNKPFLVNYYYFPIFIQLTEEEIEDYKKLTNRIKKLSHYIKGADDYQEKFERLLFFRSNLQKNAKNKLPALKQLIAKEKPLKNTIIFVSDVQIDSVMRLLSEENVLAHRFTENQGTRPKKEFGGISEREYIIHHFKKGNYQSLVAMTCLDEGIDIPCADTAILMSSSTNPREYIQRIGRVIRQSKNKENAKIYDFIISPSIDKDLNPDLYEFEKQIYEKEIIRAKEMALNALNNSEIFDMLNQQL